MSIGTARNLTGIARNLSTKGDCWIWVMPMGTSRNLMGIARNLSAKRG